MGFIFEIHYNPNQTKPDQTRYLQPGSNALSRKTIGEVELGAMVALRGVCWKELEKEIEGDLLIKELKEALMTYCFVCPRPGSHW